MEWDREFLFFWLSTQDSSLKTQWVFCRSRKKRHLSWGNVEYYKVPDFFNTYRWIFESQQYLFTLKVREESAGTDKLPGSGKDLAHTLHVLLWEHHQPHQKSRHFFFSWQQTYLRNIDGWLRWLKIHFPLEWSIFRRPFVQNTGRVYQVFKFSDGFIRGWCPRSSRIPSPSHL